MEKNMPGRQGITFSSEHLGNGSPVLMALNAPGDDRLQRAE